MAHNSKYVKILNSEEGYNLISNQYKKHHSHLDSFLNLEISRFLPRKHENLDIIDLGAGDGRIFKHFENINFRKYVACDIAEKLLEKHPKQGIKVQKIVCDLNKKLSFDDESFDIATSFFVLEHIKNLEGLFEEVYRILKNGGKRIIGHFIQRREFEWEHGKGKEHIKFKIQQYRYKLEDLKKIAEYNFFNFKYQEIVGKGVLIGYLIVCEKN
ncbi:MAG: class I SAM-dependent methyltransferase [Candidatus Absconditabacterales bacterium]|nr:class I SAM-dependent methyltransferase [Candidatus Absconditabacterales bacterium]